jgi:hypothetical protein
VIFVCVLQASQLSGLGSCIAFCTLPSVALIAKVPHQSQVAFTCRYSQVFVRWAWYKR